MARNCLIALGFGVICVTLLMAGGCVEKELTVKTVPTGAVVVLNDEELGTAPVTTSFLWYGDYRIRVTKPGYEALVTHKKIKRPLDDYPVFDFIAQVLWPGTIHHKYEWTFELAPYKTPSREELINAATQLRREALKDVNEANVPAKPKAAAAPAQEPNTPKAK